MYIQLTIISLITYQLVTLDLDLHTPKGPDFFPAYTHSLPLQQSPCNQAASSLGTLGLLSVLDQMGLDGGGLSDVQLTIEPDLTL